MLDVESSALGPAAELVEIAIVGADGGTLIDTIVRPRGQLAPDAQRVHGLDAAALARADPFEEVYPGLAKLLAGRTVIAYHAAFDHQVLDYSCELVSLSIISCVWDCAMLRYEQWRGFRASLAIVCEVESITVAGPRHRALTDARLVWWLIRRMAGESPQ